MKQINIINAYNALGSLADNKNFSSKDQWLIYKLHKELRSHFEFQQEQEANINNKYLPMADENGQITGEVYQNYVKEMFELKNMEVDMDFEKIDLPFVDGLSFKDIEPLEDFINFKPTED